MLSQDQPHNMLISSACSPSAISMCSYYHPFLISPTSLDHLQDQQLARWLSGLTQTRFGLLAVSFPQGQFVWKKVWEFHLGKIWKGLFHLEWLHSTLYCLYHVKVSFTPPNWTGLTYKQTAPNVLSDAWMKEAKRGWKSSTMSISSYSLTVNVCFC